MVGVINVRGVYFPTISVEVVGKSDTIVTVRGGVGRILYRLHPARRMTIGPYVEPGVANVIARCVSELTDNVQVASR
jgi:hypothetical protein